jgi:hypothetical protein
MNIRDDTMIDKYDLRKKKLGSEHFWAMKLAGRGMLSEALATRGMAHAPAFHGISIFWYNG